MDASAETLAHTVLGSWQPGTRVNLERALRMGDELGGHLVSGHVDGVGEVLARTPENGSTRFRIRVPAALARFIAPKGSVALNGISLTVNEVDRDDVRREHHPAHARPYRPGGAGRPAPASTSRSTRWPATWRGLAETA